MVLSERNFQLSTGLPLLSAKSERAAPVEATLSMMAAISNPQARNVDFRSAGMEFGGSIIYV